MDSTHTRDDARTANTAAEVNSDHHDSSNDSREPSNPDELHSRSESDNSHTSRSEHVASGSGQPKPVGEQSEDNPSDEDDEDEDSAFLQFLKVNPDYTVHRQEYTEALEKAGLNDFSEENWQDTFEGLRMGDVIMYQGREGVRAYPLDDKDLSWAPVPFGHMRTTIKFAIVVNLPYRSIQVHDLIAFEDLPSSVKRGQKVSDEWTGETRYALGGYMHVVALDSDGPIRSEPECFEGGVQCNWRSFDSARPPINKNWFVEVGWARTIKNESVCVVGRVAESEDITIISWISQVTRGVSQRQIAEEAQRRKVEEGLDNDSGSSSSAVGDRDQGSMYEDRDYCEGSGRISKKDLVKRRFESKMRKSTCYRKYSYVYPDRDEESTWSYDN
jgi:hypothetical protein